MPADEITSEAITVQELIRMLEDMDPEMPVHFSYDYGDHCHSEVAASVTDVDTGNVLYSEYHKMHKIVDERDDDDLDNSPANKAKQQNVVLLS